MKNLTGLRPSAVLREFWDEVIMIEEDAIWCPTEYWEVIHVYDVREQAGDQRVGARTEILGLPELAVPEYRAAQLDRRGGGR